MKFELEPDNRNCPDEVLLNDLRKVASLLQKNSLTQDEYNAHGRFCAATFKKRFASWNSALQRSGLGISRRQGIPDAELIADLKRVASAGNSLSVSKEDYSRNGRFSYVCIERRFGSWNEALVKAGLDISANWHPRRTDEELFRNLAKVWEVTGRQPKQSDFQQPLSSISHVSYTRRFGSWRKALEAFVASANDDELITPAATKEVSPVAQPERILHKRTARQPGWKLRFLVNRRDRFTCCACGRSPSTNPGTQLHLDHITPWSEGGETTFDNLQTLCHVCNIGKSTLAMYEDGVRVT